MGEVVTIELYNFTNKIKVLDDAMPKVNDQLVQIERDKVKTIATLNALQGAKQQCVNLVKELHNDEDQPAGSSDDS